MKSNCPQGIVEDKCVISCNLKRYFVTITPFLKEKNSFFCLEELRKWEKQHPTVSFLRQISLGLSDAELKFLKKNGGMSLHLPCKKEINHKFLFFEAIDGCSNTGDIKQNGKIIGAFYVAENVKYLWLGPFFSAADKERVIDASEDVIEQAFKAVSDGGGTPSDILRTWYFLSDIENDYGLFNKTRTKIYERNGIRQGTLPASTGVGFSRFLKRKVCGIVFAVVPQEKNTMKRTSISSKMQCDPFVYGSSFSRATEVDMGNWRRLFISGTASIGKKGESIRGSLQSQIEKSVEAVLAIMKDRGFKQKNIVFAMGYYNANVSVTGVERICREAGIPNIVLLPAEICRRELLFELEVECESI